MSKALSIWLGGIVAVGLVVAGLWAWRFAPELAAQNAERPYVAKLGIRGVAISLAAAGQVVLLAFVVSRLYPPRLLDRLLGICAALVSLTALGTGGLLTLLR